MTYVRGQFIRKGLEKDAPGGVNHKPLVLKHGLQCVFGIYCAPGAIAFCVLVFIGVSGRSPWGQAFASFFNNIATRVVVHTYLHVQLEIKVGKEIIAPRPGAQYELGRRKILTICCSHVVPLAVYRRRAVRGWRKTKVVGLERVGGGLSGRCWPMAMKQNKLTWTL